MNLFVNESGMLFFFLVDFIEVRLSTFQKFPDYFGGGFELDEIYGGCLKIEHIGKSFFVSTFLHLRSQEPFAAKASCLALTCTFSRNRTHSE